ncbi:HAD family hydrolase [Candidatus Woesearchaeota archaeon]|nr:HAD family hydrolase [Candidatus Woesearchaeota archaeon]
MTKSVFLDRDGALVEDVGYHHKLEDFKLIPNVVEGLRLLKTFKLIIVTNQSGIGRGFYKMEDFENFSNHLIQELKKHNIKIEKIYVCPHKPEDNCECRKPKAKLIKDAEKDFDIDLSKSFMIGDKRIDIEMGHNAGCKSILVLTGNGMKEKENSEANYVARDLLDAAKWILSEE